MLTDANVSIATVSKLLIITRNRLKFSFKVELSKRGKADTLPCAVVFIINDFFLHSSISHDDVPNDKKICMFISVQLFTAWVCEHISLVKGT